MDLKETLEECIDLLNQHGQNSKQEVKQKLERLMEELYGDK